MLPRLHQTYEACQQQLKLGFIPFQKYSSLHGQLILQNILHMCCTIVNSYCHGGIIPFRVVQLYITTKLNLQMYKLKDEN